MRPQTHIVQTLGLALLALQPLNLVGQGVEEDFHRPAKFRVTDNVVVPAENIWPLSVESFPEENVILWTDFEPLVDETTVIAEVDSPNKVIANFQEITDWNSKASGYWDGAKARVYRVVNGKLENVRRDIVVDGGFMAEGWMSAGSLGSPTNLDREWWRLTMLPPDATSARLGWGGTWAVPYDYYVGVVSVDLAGNTSDVIWQKVHLNESLKSIKGKAENPVVRSRKDTSGKDTTPPPAPSNLRVSLDKEEAIVDLTWDTATGDDVAGYHLVFSDSNPEDHRGFYYELSESPDDPAKEIRTGDVVVFEMTAPNRKVTDFAPRIHRLRTLRAPRALGFAWPDQDPDVDWEIVSHEENVGVEVPEELAEERSTSFGRYTLSNGGKADLHAFALRPITAPYGESMRTGKPYTFEAWIRYEGDAPDAKATLLVKSNIWDEPANQDVVTSKTFTPSGEWQLIRLPVKTNVPWTDEYVPGLATLELKGDGVWNVDNIRFYQSDYPFHGILPDSLHEEARQARVSIIRQMYLNLHGGAKILQLKTIAQKLHNQLEYTRLAGADPFLAFVHAFDEQDWAGLTSYLAEPYDAAQSIENLTRDDPQYWAQLRAYYGRKEPWIEEFEKVFIQVNNQPYYGIFEPWAFPAFQAIESTTGEEYPRGYLSGAMAEYCFSQMKESKSWTEGVGEKIKLSVQIPSLDVRKEDPRLDSYGYATVKAAPSAWLINSALYNGGWDGHANSFSVSEVNEGIFTSLNFNHSENTNWAKNLPTLRDHMRETGIWPEGAVIGAYEIGPGYSLPSPGLGGDIVAMENAVQKSVAGATATLDNILTRAIHGTTFQSLYTMDRNAKFFVTHAPLDLGGQPYPHWLLFELWQNQGQNGDFLEVETLSVPTLDVPNLKRRGEVQDAPMVGAYATREGNRYNVVVLSRKQDGKVDLDGDGNPEFEFGEAWSPVSLQLPFQQAEKVTIHGLFAQLRATNLEGYNVKIQTRENIPFSNGTLNLTADVTGLERDGLPPGCTVVLVFEGTR